MVGEIRAQKNRWETNERDRIGAGKSSGLQLAKSGTPARGAARLAPWRLERMISRSLSGAQMLSGQEGLPAPVDQNGTRFVVPMRVHCAE